MLKTLANKLLRLPVDLVSRFRYRNHKKFPAEIRRFGDRTFVTAYISEKRIDFHIDQAPTGPKLICRPKQIKEAFDDRTA